MSCGFDEIAVSDNVEEILSDLDRIGYQMAELRVIKEKLERMVLEKLQLACFDQQGHMTSVKHDGEQTKVIGKYKVKIKTSSLWKIDKKEYEIAASHMRSEFNPVKTSLSYRVDKRLLEDVHVYGSNEDIDLLYKFLALDYSKPNITLTLNA